MAKTTENLIEIYRDGEYLLVSPEYLTNNELCDKLNSIQLDSDEFISNSEIREWYAAIGEAIRRLEDV